MYHTYIRIYRVRDHPLLIDRINNSDKYQTYKFHIWNILHRPKEVHNPFFRLPQFLYLQKPVEYHIELNEKEAIQGTFMECYKLGILEIKRDIINNQLASYSDNIVISSV